MGKMRLATKVPFVSNTAAPSIRKIVAAGRGRVIQSEPIRKEILRLTNKKNPHVVYLGTATFDKTEPYELQGAGFAAAGCTVAKVELTNIKAALANKATIIEQFAKADIIAVSGGNTLFAMKRWRRLGVDKLLRTAMDRGAVLCGGSAGAICWFDGGHSDSLDPTTVLHVKPKLTELEKRSWKYIRVTGLGFVSGLCCPHHDTTQSNGLARSADFDDMLSKHPNEIGVGIDDQAVLVIIGDSFKVMASDTSAPTTAVRRKTISADGHVNETVFLPTDVFRPLDVLNK